MYYDITRKRVGNAGVVVVEGEDAQEIIVYDGEGKQVTNVQTAYDCPEDNTVKRLGILDFAELLHQAACSDSLPVNGAFDQAEHYHVTDGQDTHDSYNVLLPIKYLVSDEVILYTDVQGYCTPFAVDFTIDEHPVDVFNQHMQASGFLAEDERYEEVKK